MPRKAKSADTDTQSEAVEAALKNVPPAGDAAAGGINEKIRQLIRHSKEQGYLTYADINEALPESVDNPEDIENVISILQNLEIEILEPDQVEDYKQRQEEAEVRVDVCLRPVDELRRDLRVDEEIGETGRHREDQQHAADQQPQTSRCG